MTDEMTIGLIVLVTALLLSTAARGLYLAVRRRRVRPFWVVTCYFNPSGYRSIKRNYDRFIAELKRQKIPVRTVELSYTGQFVITTPGCIHVHAKDVMWHKERLLNIAIKSLPEGCKYVAWVDADVTFLNENWADDALIALRKYGIVQLFEQVQLLDPVGNFYRTAYGYAFSHVTGFTCDPCGNRYPYQHQENCRHTGFAWAARMEHLKELGGLYDKHIMGGGDYQMALAFFGHIDDAWYDRFTGAFKADLLRWSARCFEIVKGNVGYVRGGIIHHWHGHADDRNYVDRTRILNQYAYDPNADIALNEHDVWEWATCKRDLHRAVRAYFEKRNDDACYPVNPTRYADKIPVITSNPKEMRKFQAFLFSMARQTRQDFVLHVLCADWTVCGVAKQIVRSHPWPFEVRFRVFSGVPTLPRRLEAALQLRRETRARKAILVHPNRLYPETHLAELLLTNHTIHYGGEIAAIPMDILPRLAKRRPATEEQAIRLIGDSRRKGS